MCFFDGSNSRVLIYIPKNVMSSQVMEEQGQSVQWSMKKWFVNGVYGCIRYTLWLLNIAMEAMALRNR